MEPAAEPVQSRDTLLCAHCGRKVYLFGDKDETRCIGCFKASVYVDGRWVLKQE